MADDVTVVIPTRNRADLLATTLHSVQVAIDEARRVGWGARVLVVDDVSDDDQTRVVAQAAGADYVRIDVHDGRNNPASAIVLGVSSVTTPYLTLFGDDDIMLPRYLVAHLEKLAQGYDLCVGSFARTDAHLRVTKEVVLLDPHLGDLLAGVIGINDGAMVRTDLMQAGPWDASQDQRVIYPVWLTILTNGARTTSISEITWLYRRHDANISDRLDPEDSAARAAVLEPFRQAYLDRGERIPASRAQILADESEAWEKQHRRVDLAAREKAARAQAIAAEKARLKRERWDATPWTRKLVIRIRRRSRRILQRFR